MSLVQPGTSQHGVDFSPGFLDTPDPVTLPPGATPDARNAFLYRLEMAGTGNRRATMGMRPGHLLLTPALPFPPAELKGSGLHEFRPELADRQLLAKIGTTWVRFDGVSAWVATGASGFENNAPGRLAVLKNEALLHDGTHQQMYDGTAVRQVGFARPTGVQPMVAATGPGPTGTYTARYTWYDEDHAHESSPSLEVTAPLTITNQGRTHEMPLDPRPANVTDWRIYVRREDTFERYWMFVGMQKAGVAGSTFFTEAIVDAARRQRLPEDFENDPPTVDFFVLATWKGFGIGFTNESPDMHLSKQGDLESWDPSHIFTGILTQGGDLVVSAHNYGTEIVLQKPTQSFYLAGDRVPFAVVDLHSGFGNVSQESAMEIEGLFYAWDRDKGPYRTDLGSRWEPLADGRIDATVAQVRAHNIFGGDIRIAHDPAHNLVCWSVQTTTLQAGAGFFNATILAYHYVLNCWYPPITGLRIGALTAHLPDPAVSAFGIGLYAVDESGRLHRLFADQTRDSVPSGTVQGTLTEAAIPDAGPSTIFLDDTAAFYTIGAGLAGRRLAVCPPGGVWEWYFIGANTATTLTIGSSVVQRMPAGTSYRIGAIDFYWWTPPYDAGAMTRQKRSGWLTVQQAARGPSATAPQGLEVGVRIDTDGEPYLLRRFDQIGQPLLTVVRLPVSDVAVPVGPGVPPEAVWVATHGGAKWREVDDPLNALDEDASTILTAEPGCRQGFRTSPIDLPMRAQAIRVEVVVRARTSVDAAVELAVQCLMDGVLYGERRIGPLTTSYGSYTATFLTNPQTLVAWTPIDLRTGLAVSIEPTIGGATQTIVTQLFVRVSYRPGHPLNTLKKRLQRAFYTAQLRFRNVDIDQRIEVLQYQLDADFLPRRSVRSGP